MKKLFGLLLVCALSTALGQQEPSAVSVHENVTFAPGLQLDVFEPAQRAGNLPGIILIHGGGWTSADKSTMRGMSNYLARVGFVAFAIDYRLLHGVENQWPAQLEDAQKAVRWVRAHAAAYGVDPNEIGAFGHSAGAQIAAMLGMVDTKADGISSKVQAVVDVSGPVDFTTEKDPDGIQFLTAFLGTQDRKAWESASPVFHVAKDNAPFLIVHGTHDDNVPIAQSQELYDKLKAAGVPAQFIQVDDAHTFQKTDVKRRLARESAAFFNHYLGSAR